MKVMSLTKVYYKDYNNYEAIYQQRYNSCNAVHFPIHIQQYNHKKSYPLFFNYTASMALLSEKIYKAHENLNEILKAAPTILLEQFYMLSVLQEVKASNDIEGVHSTRKELMAILDSNTAKPSRFRGIVLKYVSLLAGEPFFFTESMDIRAFYDEFVHKEIIAENANNELDGKIFRGDSVDVTSATGKIIHRGVNPEAKIISLMEQSLDILNSDELPLLVRVSLFHYLFAYIHPFYDGNGRTDRYISSYYLSKHFNSAVALRLSVIIKKNKAKYYALFAEADSEINRGDMTPFITEFMQIILETFQDATAYIVRKQKQLDAYQKKLARLVVGDELLQDIYDMLLQATLFYGKGVSISEIEKKTGKSRVTVQTRLDSIPGSHLLVTKKGKTNYYKLNMLMFKT